VDNDPASPRNVTFTVSGVPAGALTDVQADFTMNPVHTWGGDVDITLIAPDSTQFVIFASTGATTAAGVGDSSDLSGPYVFTDSAAGTNWWAAAATAGAAVVIPPGSYRTTQAGPQAAANFSPPTNLTAAFAAVANPNGTWTMRFTDNAAGDTGAVSAANLRLTRFVGARVARQAVLAEKRIDCDSPEGRMIVDQLVDDMDAAIKSTVEKLTGSGVVSAAGNRRAFRISEEPLDSFRRYMSVYAREQALCHFSPALIANLERNWNAASRRA